MSATSAAVRGRLVAESLMTSTCTIRERRDGFVTDPDTLEVVPATGDVIYTGKCRVRSPGGGADAGSGTALEVGGAEVFTYNLLVSVPFSAVVPEGSIVTVDASPDPGLVGIRAEVGRTHRHENGTARRLYCREAT